MGVDGLHKFINKNCPEIVKTINISDLKGKSCVIDGMQHVYSQLIYMRTRNKEVITEDGKNISHLYGLISSLKYYLKNEIIPIFVFDGKSPEIKKKKIEERKKALRENLQKLNELSEMKKIIEKMMKENKNNEELDENTEWNLSSSEKFNSYNNCVNNLKEIIDIKESKDEDFCNKLIFGTPPNDSYIFKLEELGIGIGIKNKNKNEQRIEEIDEEYKKIYKKSILFKDYFIIDWIEVITFLGLPVIKAEGEADPVCSFISKYNPNVSGIISDDSDMLVFGAPTLMRKSKHQNFQVIELKNLIKGINKILNEKYFKKIDFCYKNLVDFSILLGTDYGSIELKERKNDSMEILEYYVSNDMNINNVINENQIEEFSEIKKYYVDNEDELNKKYKNYLMKPIWKQPKLEDIKKRLMELDVEEEYIDKTNGIFSSCYREIKNSKNLKISNRKIQYYNKITEKIYEENMENDNTYDKKFEKLFSNKNNVTFEEKNNNHINVDANIFSNVTFDMELYDSV